MIEKLLNQQELASRAGLGKRGFEKLLQRGTTSLGTLEFLALALGVEPKELLPSDPEPRVASSLFQLPALAPDFKGREDEIRRMVKLLGGVGEKAAVSALQGMGGVGKTSLAVKVAHEVRDRFPDGQLMLDLLGMSAQPLTTTAVMSRIIRDFHPATGKLPDTEAELLPRYRSALAGKRCLILLDNAKDEEQVQQLVDLPPPVGFIVTSRNAIAPAGGLFILLDVPPPDEAVELLRGIVGAKGTVDQLHVLAELCGRLPLALRVAGDFLRLHRNRAVPWYIEALKEEGKRWERLKGRTKAKDVEAVLGLSAAELVRSDPEQAERWQMLSVFPADFAPDAAAAVWGLKTGDELDTDTAEDELTDLLDRSLLQYDEPTGRYNLHDLMRPVARVAFGYIEDCPMRVDSAECLSSAELRFAQHYQAVLATSGDLYREGSDGVLRGLALFDLEDVNIRCGQRWAADHRTEEPSIARLCWEYQNTGAHFIHLRLIAREWIAWSEAAVEACRHVEDKRREGAALGNLGLAYARLGDAEVATRFHGQALTLARESGERRMEGLCLGNLGLAHAQRGDTHAAIECYQKALDVAREIKDRWGEGNALGNLGLAHADLGNARAAISFYEQVLAINREIGDRRSEGMTLGYLGLAHADIGDIQAAIDFHQQAITIAREIGDRLGEAETKWNMALALRFGGRQREAILLAEQSLAFFESIVHPRAERDRKTLAEWREEAPRS